VQVLTQKALLQACQQKLFNVSFVAHTLPMRASAGNADVALQVC
jgi:hypothetical protein